MLTSGLVIVQLFAQSSDRLWEIVDGRPSELETDIRIIVRRRGP
jgi:hypothetical protein